MPKVTLQHYPLYYDDINMGDKWISNARTITECDIVAFLSIGRMTESIFTDREFYEHDTIFDHNWNRRLVPGILQLCVMAGFFSALGLMGRGSLAYLGMDELRIPNPTFTGDTLHLEVECVRKKKTAKNPNRGVITYHMLLKNQKGEVCQSSYQSLLYQNKPED
jgi:acyl dehydratase